MLTDNLRDKIVQLLRAEAQRLGREGTPIPVDALAKEMGLQIRLISSTGTRRRAALTNEQGTWTIAIYRRSQAEQHALSARERFAAAHELAHYLVEQQVAFRPQRDRDYWQLERICDEFAGEVLVPDDLVSEGIQKWTGSASSLISIVRWVSDHAEVSSAVSARRLVEKLPAPAAVLGAQELLGRRDVRAVVSWLADPNSLLNLRERAYIKPGHPVESVLAAHTGTVAGEARGHTGAFDVSSIRTSRREILVAATH